MHRMGNGDLNSVRAAPCVVPLLYLTTVQFSVSTWGAKTLSLKYLRNVEVQYIFLDTWSNMDEG